MKTALLVIDVQQSFTHRPYFDTANAGPFLAAQNALIQGCQAQGLPVVRVFHHAPGATSDDPFSMASGLVRPLQGLADFDADHTVYKTRHSALVGTGLDVWLVQQNIGRLIVSGIRTEQCCETTTRHASDLGWQVLFANEATLSFDMVSAPGQHLTLADIRQRTAAVLQDRFADVVTVQEALRLGLGAVACAPAHHA